MGQVAHFCLMRISNDIIFSQISVMRVWQGCLRDLVGLTGGTNILPWLELSELEGLNGHSSKQRKHLNSIKSG